MKQRLLLALLVLFASVGTTWGADGLTFKVPSNIGTVTLTVTGDGAAECIEIPEENSTISLSNKTYTIKNNSGTEKEYTVKENSNVTKLSFSVSGGAAVTAISGGDGIAALKETSASKVGLKKVFPFLL